MLTPEERITIAVATRTADSKPYRGSRPTPSLLHNPYRPRAIGNSEEQDFHIRFLKTYPTHHPSRAPIQHHLLRCPRLFELETGDDFSPCLEKQSPSPPRPRARTGIRCHRKFVLLPARRGPFDGRNCFKTASARSTETHPQHRSCQHVLGISRTPSARESSSPRPQRPTTVARPPSQTELIFD